MSDKLHFELVSPEKLLMSADVDMVVVPGVEGDFGVLAHHAPVVSTLRIGILQVFDGDTPTSLLICGGFAEVNPGGLTILAEEVTPLSEIDSDSLATALKEAEEDMTDAKDDIQKSSAQARRDRLAEMLRVLELAA